MIVGMHLYITGANINLITFALQTMVMRLLAVVLAFAKLYRTVVGRRESQESMRQTLTALLVPLQVAHDFLALAHNLIDSQAKHFRTVEMLA